MKYDGLDESHSALLQAASEAMTRAYAPYSKFQVGAALLDDEGHVHYGCNVENAAYGPTNCAERTALYRAIADGKRPGQFYAIAIIGDTKEPVTPCGVCRQVMIELCPPNMPVIMGSLNGQWKVAAVSDLLPGAFNTASLENEER